MRKLFFLAILLLASKSLLLAQSVPTIKLSGLTGNSAKPLLDLAAQRVTDALSMPTDTLDARTFRRTKSDGIVGRDSIQWLRFDLLNDLPSPQRRIFQSPYQNDVVDFYFSRNNFKTWSHRRIGAHVPFYEVDYRFDNCRLPVDLAAGQRLSVLVKLENRYFPQSDANIWLQTEQGLKNDFWSMYSRNFNGVYLRVLILGAVLAIFLFVAFLYITTRDSLYLYYGLYLGGVALYFATKTDSLFFVGYWVGGFPKLAAVLNEPIQMLYTAFYIRFSMGLLRMKAYDLRLHRFLDFSWKALAAYSLVLIPISALIWKREFETALLAFDRAVLLLFTFIMLARIIQKNRSPLLGYFLVGNALFLTGVVLSTLLSLELIEIGELFASLSPINHFQIGVLGEVMCFSFALGYNVRLLERERNNNQMAYIGQLQINQEFVEKSNRDLTEKLDERTKEVMAMSEAMQVQKEAHLRSEFEFQLGEMEMQALRAQMNPHFIFNSLNTIRYFVLNNENEKASDYLGKFARLLRMVLQNSRENTIPLSEELEALRLYLEIEARRFGDSFQYRIIIPEDLDTDGIIVPPLLLQPFAENAIWHGLLHSDKPNKELLVRISEEEDACVFTIEDNGVGRDKAREMKSRSATAKKSFGMQITNKRVELFNKNFASQIEIDVRDLVSPDGEAAGTAVEIRYLLNFE